MKKTFDAMNESINPPADLNRKVLEQLEPRRRAHFRPVVAVAAMLVLILAATPVMASRIPTILERIAPELVEELAPVQLSDADSGITIEVVAASVHGNAAEMVVKIEGETMKDRSAVPLLMIEGSRGTTSYDVLRDYEGAELDRKTGIMYCRLVMTYGDGTAVADILGDELTVLLNEIILSSNTGPVEVPIILTDYETMTVDAGGDKRFFVGYGYRDGYEYRARMREYVLMTPGEPTYQISDRMELTGAAFIEGKLHIQICARKDNPNTWNYQPKLVDENGNEIWDCYSNCVRLKADGGEDEYAEWVFDISEEDLDNYTLMVESTDSARVFCDCSVTFRISDLEYTVE